MADLQNRRGLPWHAAKALYMARWPWGNNFLRGQRNGVWRVCLVVIDHTQRTAAAALEEQGKEQQGGHKAAGLFLGGLATVGPYIFWVRSGGRVVHSVVCFSCLTITK